ncbi:MAG: hypothetical protein NT144_12275 [Bacteroidia bacterium]|nr:hypothetical protein [Bacteroidia bacterium]
MKNVIGDAKYQTIEADLDKALMKHLKKTNDEFLPEDVYICKWDRVLCSLKQKEKKGTNSKKEDE